MRKLASSLQRRQQHARRHSRQDGLYVDELWQVWEDGAQFAITAKESWSAGRDAVLAMLAGPRRAEALQRLQHVLVKLRDLGLESSAASCLEHISALLSDQELLEQLQAIEAPPAIVRLLTNDLRRRAADAAHLNYSAEPTVESARLVGRILISEPETREDTVTSIQEGLEEQTLEARALHFVRSHGTETAAGITYEAQYALWRMLTEEDIDSLGLQNLEDIRVVHLRNDGSTETEHVQAKKRDIDWSIPDLQGRGSDANKVFDSFAEVALAEPEARLTFGTDARLTRGLAPNLLRAAQKFRDISPDRGRLGTVALASVGLSTDETRALEQLRSNMRPDLGQRLNLPGLLARVNFDAGRTRRELRSEIIRRISALLSVADPAAEDAYLTFIGLFLEQMEVRKEFSREEIQTLIRKAGVKAQAFRDRVGIGTRVEVLDFGRVGEASVERYYQGQSSAPADIAAGLDALRPSLLAEIRQVLAERRCCVIRAPSGQGKTTLLYRYAYETAHDALVLRVHRLDHAAVAEVTHLIEPLGNTTVLVLVDNLTSGDRREWSEALLRLLERPQLWVLATSREDDWRLAAVSALEGIVGFVYPKLDEHTAEVIFDGLASIDGLPLHAEHWREPFEQSGGLLMEYVHLLTQGRRMRDVIADQVARLEQNLALNGPMVLGALRYISTAHRYGGYVSRATLSKLVPPSPGTGIGQALRVLEDEFWIRDTADGRYTGLHQVRSQIVSDVLHESDPIAETVEQLLRWGDANEIGAVLEDVLYREPQAYPNVLTILAKRTTTEGARFGIQVATAAYAAEERRHADAVFRMVARQGLTSAQVLLPTLATLPRPVEIASLVSLLPEGAKTRTQKLLATLPRRKYEKRAEILFLQLVGPERLAQWLTRDAERDECADMLRLLAIAAPEIGQAALNSAEIDVFTDRIREAGPLHLADLISSVREVDVTVALRIANRLGPEFTLEQALRAIDCCYAARVDGEAARAQFIVNNQAGIEQPNDLAVRITGVLYGLFPEAMESEVTGYLSAGTPHPEAKKQIPRENMPPAPHHVVLNQFWLSLARDRLSAKSLVAVLRLHDEYATKLLEALDSTYRYLNQPSQASGRALLDMWKQVQQSGASVPYVPRQTGPLLSSLASGPAQSHLLGLQPLDQAFENVKGAAGNAGRELGQYIAGGKHRNAILSDQLAQLHREALAYRELRACLPFLDADDERWGTTLPSTAAKLRDAIVVVAASTADRRHRAEAQRLYGAFSELRALSRDLVGEVQSAAANALNPSKLLEKTNAQREILDELFLRAHGWEPLEVLGRILRVLGGATHPLMADDEAGGQATTVDLTRLLSGLDAIVPLDLEVWLAHHEARSAFAQLERQVCAELGARGIDAICQVLPPSLEEPLFGSAFVVAQTTNLLQLEQVRSAVRDIGFRILPSEVGRLVLVLQHVKGAMMPVVFQTWRTSGNPFSEALGLAHWSPLADIEPLARQLGLEVDRREHPVAQGVVAVRHRFGLLLLAFGQLAAMTMAVASSGWSIDYDVVGRQIDSVTDHMRYLADGINELVVITGQNPEWEPVTLLVFDAVGAFLDGFIRSVNGELAQEHLKKALERKTEDAWASSDNLLYLGTSVPNIGLSIDELEKQLQSATERFLALRQQLVDELSHAVGST